MRNCSRRSAIASLLGASTAIHAAGHGDSEWTPLFDGKSLRGWKAGENAASFRVADGAILTDGPRSHLFYAGGLRNAEFKNFEFKAEVMTRPGANSGIYFHTRFQQSNWPSRGFEVQVNNTHAGEGRYRERKKTGSLYGIRNVYKKLAADDEWFELHIAVRGKQVQVRLNGTLLVDYVEPDPPVRTSPDFEQALGRGTFALQCHDPASKVAFRNIRVRPLPDDLAENAAERPIIDDNYRDLLRMSSENFPLVDYHVHLRGITLEEALARSRRLGIGFGFATNCGIGFPVQNDAAAREYLNSLRGQPAFVGLQGEGREWTTLVSKETIAAFDYTFTDAMTFTDDNGKRMRLWINGDVGQIADKDRFLDMYVDRIAGILKHEPIDIYASPTFLPKVIAADYDRLWTSERMQRVIGAARDNGVAIEINNRYRVPRAAFIKQAKAAGVKFAFGSNNGAGAPLGRLEYCIDMVKECGLTWEDIFVPKPDGQKPVQLRS